MIYIKSQKDIEQIKKAASIWKIVKQELIKNTVVGVSLKYLDELANKVAIENNAKCSFYLYRGFMGHICICVNEQLIHNIPNDYLIKDGDLVTFDVGIEYNSYHCDAAFNVIVPPIGKQKQSILLAAEKCLENAIKMAIPNNYVGDISNAIYTTAKEYGYEVIKDYGGHGCGIKIHEDPIILNYGKPKTNAKLLPGMVICIEPMLMTDTDEYYLAKNQWTVIPVNKKLTCHIEHMILITANGNEVLTT